MLDRNDLILNHLSRPKQRTLRSLFNGAAETMTVGEFLNKAALRPSNARVKEIMAEIMEQNNQVTHPAPATDLDLDFPAYRLLSPAMEGFTGKKNRLGEITARELLEDTSRTGIRREARGLCARYIENGGVINGYATDKGVARIPSRVQPGVSLYSRFEELFKEAIELSVNDPHATRFNNKYFEIHPFDINRETLRLSIIRFIDNLRSGEIQEGYPWFVVDTSIFAELETMLNEYSGRSVSDFEHAIGCTEGTLAGSFLKEVIKSFGFDVPNGRYAENFICRENAVGATQSLYRILDNILSVSILPLSISDLLSRVLEDGSTLESFDNLEAEIRNWITNNPNALITDDDEVSYVGEALRLEEHRVARLLNELQSPVSDSDLRAAFKAQYNRDPQRLNTHKLADLGCRRGRNQVWYITSEEVSLLGLVEKFVDTQKGPFTFDAVKKALGDICQFYDDITIRSYITNFCRVNNTDSSLFCPVELVDEDSQGEWRKKSDQNQTHYYLMALINLLTANGDSMDFEDCVKQLKGQGKADGYNTSNIKPIIRKYADATKEDYFLKLNQDVVSLNRGRLNQLDLMTLGRKGRYIGVVMPIISFASKILNDQSNIALTELSDIIKENINPDISRTSIQRLIIEYGNDIEIKKLDGVLTVCFADNHQFQAEPKYEIVESADEPGMTASVETQPRISLSSILGIDWELLKKMVVKELGYHVRTGRLGSDFNLQEAVSNYFDFIGTSGNKLLCERIPRGIYRYFLGATDVYDRYGFLTDIILGFEGMLRDFLPRNGIIPQHVIGLRELIYTHYYENIYLMSDDDGDYTSRMSQTLNDLIFKRNLLAHGQYIELSSIKMALCLINYLALSIYVFNVISAQTL